MSFVLDNSLAIAWCFTDEVTTATEDLLERVAQTGAVAPWLWPLEAANTLLMAERRGRITAAERLAFAKLLHTLPITLDEDGVSQIWTATTQLAERFQLTIYHSVYLELAERRGLPLATLDNDLRGAAEGLGVPLLGL